MDLNQYNIDNTKVGFYNLPEDLVDHLSDMLSPYLSPLGMENATKGIMTPLSWYNKFEELKKILC